jgi:23S rRNA (adenine2503-C2)-methyltransferase
LTRRRNVFFPTVNPFAQSPDYTTREIEPDLSLLLPGNAAGMGLDELRLLFKRLDEAPYRASQAFEGIYRHRWDDWDRFTNLPKSLRIRLASAVQIKWPEIERTLTSSDGSSKHTLKLADGYSIECVYMPYENRATLCISTQAGCAMACAFCATGAMGLKRNLTSAEIAGQAMALITFHLGARTDAAPINIVFMGMGEPLHNFGNVMGAFAVLSHPKGLAIPPRRVTISTAGLAPGIKRLGECNPRPRLALSLNATTNEARSKIMPVNSTWGLEALSQALRSFPLESGERITLEYALIEGISDGLEDAKRLSKFAGQFPSKINLIPYNACPGAGLPEMSPPSDARINEIGAYLANRGHIVSVRRSRGSDIGGACGQLAFK